MFETKVSERRLEGLRWRI